MSAANSVANSLKALTYTMTQLTIGGKPENLAPMRQICICDSPQLSTKNIRDLLARYKDAAPTMFCARHTVLNDKCLQLLANSEYAKTIKMLDLSYTCISKKAITHFSSFKALVELTLRGSALVDAAMRCEIACRMPTLRWIDGKACETVMVECYLGYLLACSQSREKPNSQAQIVLKCLKNDSRGTASQVLFAFPQYEALCKILHTFFESSRKIGILNENEVSNICLSKVFHCTQKNSILFFPERATEEELKNLGISRNTFLELIKDAPVQKVCGAMENLVLSKVELPETALGRILDYFPNLRTVDMCAYLRAQKDANRAKDAFLTVVWKTIGLTSLQVDGVLIDALEIEQLVAFHPHIKLVQLKNAKLNDDTLLQLCKLTDIHILDISGSVAVTEKALEHAVSQLKKLKMLHLAGCPQISTATRTALAKKGIEVSDTEFRIQTIDITFNQK